MKKTVLFISGSTRLYIAIDICINKIMKWDAHFLLGVSGLDVAINKCKPDILLLNYYDAGVPGEEALKMLMPYKRDAGMSIIGIISGIRQEENGEMGKDWNSIGLDGHIFMPFNPVEFKRMLSKSGLYSE